MIKSNDARRYSPATLRNRQPILDILQRELPPNGTILEVASGTGEHAVFFAPHLAPRKWLPSDPSPQARASIAAWRDRETTGTDNLYPPINLDVCAPVWSVEMEELPLELSGSDFQRGTITAIVNINMIHISPWSACLGLMMGAGRLLPPGGILYLYGPFKQGGTQTAPSNLAFDEALRAEDPNWGVRDLEEVVAVAQVQHLSWKKTYPMPANNLSVVFQRRRL